MLNEYYRNNVVGIQKTKTIPSIRVYSVFRLGSKFVNWLGFQWLGF